MHKPTHTKTAPSRPTEGNPSHYSEKPAPLPKGSKTGGKC